MKNSKKIAYCGVLSALATVFLVAGAYSKFGFTAGFLASVCVVSNAIIFPKGIINTLVSFVLSTTLASFLAPTFFQILPYALLFAPLCVVKLWVDESSLNTVVKWVVKTIVFELCFIAYLLIYRFLFVDLWNMTFSSEWLVVVVVVSGQIAFVVYQFAFNVIFKWLKVVLPKILRK